MTESSQTDGAEPFDAKEFARQTIWIVEFGGDSTELLEDRLMRLEEIIAARWPRSMFLRRRLAREIRASVAGYAVELYPRGDFHGRRGEWHSEQIGDIRQNRVRGQDGAL